MMKLNETPVRTSRNFNINNIKIEDLEMPKKIEDFKNIKIKKDSTKIVVENKIENYEIEYGVGDILVNQVKENSNAKYKILVDCKTNKECIIDFTIDEDNKNLLENIEITANEETKATVILKYKTLNNVQAFHNGIIKLLAKQKSNINVIIVNLTNSITNNFLTIDNELKEDAKVKYTIIDFGGKNTISNLYSNLLGNKSDCKINCIYLGKENQLIDINYIAELRGEKSNVNIEVQGALKDNARKHFKGTIDFKSGCKKASGNENENCMLLSDTARSLALPMLLCSEEDVEGNHSSSAGKVGEKELFYIMSRGFNIKEAMKLMVRAKFNGIIETITNEELRHEILEEIDKALD